MPTLRFRRRDDVTDTIARHMGCCARCRSPLRADFGECLCGARPTAADGMLSVFFSARLADWLKAIRSKWHRGIWTADRVDIRGRRGAALFCALAKCGKCGMQAISVDTLTCACGEQYGSDLTKFVSLPYGVDSLLYTIGTRYKGAARRFHSAQSVPPLRRSTKSSRPLQAMYNLQKGRCYYCGKLLGRFGAPGAFVRDHLTPLRSHWRDEVDYQDYGNLALTCWDCNEEKHDRTEGRYWIILGKRHGLRWVARRKAANVDICQWRKAIRNMERRTSAG